MPTESRILTTQDCEKIVLNLDECLALFAKKPGLLNGPEIRAKSLLAVVRNELTRKAQDGSSRPFDE